MQLDHARRDEAHASHTQLQKCALTHSPEASLLGLTASKQTITHEAGKHAQACSSILRLTVSGGLWQV